MAVIAQVNDVKKVYMLGSVALTVLKGVSMHVEQGEMVSIMGPSGSGKSTLLNLLGALDVPTEGQVLVGGVDLSTLESTELAQLRNKRIGFIFQSFHLIHRMSALGNVEVPMIFAGVAPEKRKVRASEVLAEVGLLDRISHRPSELSGGEQQRVAIARALVNKPDIVLCDEPTGNVDTKTGAEIIALLKKLNQEGQTFIVVTHDHEIAHSCHRIIYLRDGVVEREDTVK